MGLYVHNIIIITWQLNFTRNMIPRQHVLYILGCHRYDVSALNCVLGKMFSFQEGEYMGGEQFFRRVDQDPLPSPSPDNTTRPQDLASLEM